MGLGSMIFMVPHFTAEPNLTTTTNHSNSDNICRGVSLREQDMGLGERFHPVWFYTNLQIKTLTYPLSLTRRETLLHSFLEKMKKFHLLFNFWQWLSFAGRLSSGLSSPPLAPHNNLRGDNCIQGSPSTAGPVMLFVFAQLLLGCGGSPLFTLGTTYIDDHVRPESASLYIGELLVRYVPQKEM